MREMLLSNGSKRTVIHTFTCGPLQRTREMTADVHVTQINAKRQEKEDKGSQLQLRALLK